MTHQHWIILYVQAVKYHEWAVYYELTTESSWLAVISDENKTKSKEN